MITQIFVENNKIDISKDLDASLSFNIDDIKDFGSRNTTFSKTIVIPGTANNNIIFGNIFDLKTSKIYNDAAANIGENYDISKSAKCIIIQGGIQVFKGVLRIMQIIIDNKAIEYECSVFGELGGFMSKLSAKKLTDLDFSDYDHYYYLANIKKSWDYGRFPSFNRVFFDGQGAITVASIYREFDNIDLIYELYPIGTNVTFYGTTNFDFTANVYDIFFSDNNKRLDIFFLYTSIIDETVEWTCRMYNNTKATNYNPGYFYPLIDYGNYSVAKHDWDIRTFRPALFVKDIINKIFNQAGYTYECPLFDRERFEKMVIPFTKKILTTKKFAYLETQFTQQFNLGSYGYYTEIVQDIELSTLNLSAFTTTDNITYKYIGTETALFDLLADFKVDYWRANYDSTDRDNPRTQYILDIYKNGSLLRVIDYKNYPSPARTIIPSPNSPIVETISLDNSFELSTNDEVKFVLKFKNVDEIRFVNAYFVINSNDQITAPINVNDKILMNETVPENILQKDFFASIVKLFNLYVYEDKFRSNHLIIKPYVEYMEFDNVIDWTYKMDVSKPITIKPLSELNSRYYDYKFKDDSDYYNELFQKRYNKSYGSYIFDTAYEFAKDRTAVELIFSGTPLVGYTGGEDKIYSTIMKRTGNGPYTEENTDSNIRILQTKIVDCNLWHIKNGESNLDAYTQYPYAGHFDDPTECNNDLNFGIMNEYFFKPSIAGINVNQFNIYWLPYMYEIVDQDSRLLIATFRLNEVDIANLKFDNPIYINGVLFRLNKIENYNAISRDTCKVELLKVIQQYY
jgi:hypothetical protein